MSQNLKVLFRETNKINQIEILCLSCPPVIGINGGCEANLGVLVVTDIDFISFTENGSRTSLNIVVFLLLLTSCSSFQKIELYDLYMVSDEAVERVMLNAEQTQLWYNLDQCGTHEFKTVNDERVLHLNWNKVDCDWVGFGNSWSNFEADDISELYDNSAIRIEVKTVDDEQQFLPFVVGLEDYSGGNSFVFSDTRKYLDGLKISDDEWSYLYLPLWHFDFSQQGVDPFGIKQMVIQLEGAGNVYLKEIKVVPFGKEQYASLEINRESLRPKGVSLRLFSLVSFLSHILHGA